MNSQFTDEQIKAYAAQFRGSDAIWCNGKWRKVSESPWGLRCKSPNRYVIHRYDGEVVIDGFKEEEIAYRVTTLEDYKLQGGEKIVRLGESDDFRTFGKVYETDNGAKYRDDKGILRFPLSSSWGVIPRYEQVKNVEKGNVSDEEFDEFLNTLDKVLEPVKPDNQLEHVVHYPTAADREEEVLKLQTFELFTSENTSEEIIQELKEIAVIGINKGDYEESIKAIELIKEWEENSK